MGMEVSKNRNQKRIFGVKRENVTGGGGMLRYDKLNNVWILKRSGEVSTLYFMKQWYSTVFVRVPPDVIYFQVCTPNLLVYNSSYATVYSLRLK
jgi:hypothetical protein